jgi:tetratricopeptide (TPR) repeat protein
LASGDAKFILSAPKYGIFIPEGRGKYVLPKHLKQVGKIIAAVALVIVMVIAILYGSLLRGIDRAAEDYTRGDPEAALKQYDNVEQRLRSLGAIRIIPARDRQNLFLNQARLLYALGRYDDAKERMDHEAEISGSSSNDSRFLLLKGELAFRAGMKNYRDSTKRDIHLLEESLQVSEDTFRDSLRLNPSDWDAKYDFEYINYLRNLMNNDQKGQIKILMENVRLEDQRPPALPADQSP